MNDTQRRLHERLPGVLTFPGLARPKFAVAAAIVCAEEPQLLAEVRAAGISQSGDPCFPGGHIEPGETPAEAALREMEEELGIRAEPSQLLGQLPTVHTPLGVHTDVFVCALTEVQAAQIRPNPEEVACVLRAPMSYFLQRPFDDEYPVQGHIIWGMTARAIHRLCEAWEKAGL